MIGVNHFLTAVSAASLVPTPDLTTKAALITGAAIFSSFPDTIEFIGHRHLGHLIELWLGLSIASYLLLEGVLGAFFVGAALSAALHVLLDAFSNRGVPWGLASLTPSLYTVGGLVEYIFVAAFLAVVVAFHLGISWNEILRAIG